MVERGLYNPSYFLEGTLRKYLRMNGILKKLEKVRKKCLSKNTILKKVL